MGLRSDAGLESRLFGGGGRLSSGGLAKVALQHVGTDGIGRGRYVTVIVGSDGGSEDYLRANRRMEIRRQTRDGAGSAARTRNKNWGGAGGDQQVEFELEEGKKKVW